MKCCFDIFVSAVLALLLLPAFLVIALAVKLFGGAGPVLFKQERAGKYGAPFLMWKFRSMVDRAEDKGAGLSIERDDPRITDIGKLLRATSLDELPQLWNVLKGEMSLVGPRPLPMKYVPRYSSEQRRRLDVRPGITGLSQVRWRNSGSWDDRLATDVEYVDTQSLCGDLAILASTFTTILRREGVTQADGGVREFMGADGRPNGENES